jgi:hypothetical protein
MGSSPISSSIQPSTHPHNTTAAARPRNLTETLHPEAQNQSHG